MGYTLDQNLQHSPPHGTGSPFYTIKLPGPICGATHPHPIDHPWRLSHTWTSMFPPQKALPPKTFLQSLSYDPIFYLE